MFFCVPDNSTPPFFSIPIVSFSDIFCPIAKQPVNYSWSVSKAEDSQQDVSGLSSHLIPRDKAKRRKKETWHLIHCICLLCQTVLNVRASWAWGCRHSIRHACSLSSCSGGPEPSFQESLSSLDCELKSLHVLHAPYKILEIKKGGSQAKTPCTGLALDRHELPVGSGCTWLFAVTKPFCVSSPSSTECVSERLTVIRWGIWVYYENSWETVLKAWINFVAENFFL